MQTMRCIHAAVEIDGLVRLARRVPESLQGRLYGRILLLEWRPLFQIKIELVIAQVLWLCCRWRWWWSQVVLVEMAAKCDECGCIQALQRVVNDSRRGVWICLNLAQLAKGAVQCPQGFLVPRSHIVEAAVDVDGVVDAYRVSAVDGSVGALQFLASRQYRGIHIWTQ